VVSRRLPIATARVRTQVRSCEICDTEVAIGAGFLRVLRFPCQFSLRQLVHIHPSSGDGTVDKIVAYVLSGLTQYH
jgi:hypothetical protein